MASGYNRLLRVCLGLGLMSLLATCGGGGSSSGGGETGTAPAITAQPQSQTVTAPATATFTVTATGSPAPTYQWNLGGTAISGATSASYTTPVTTPAMNGGSYTVTVTNASGTLTSSAAILTVTTPAAPVITLQPQSRVVTAPATATFTVTATGSPATYQWKRAGVDIPGATSASYTTPATSLDMTAGSYTVTVTNDLGASTSAQAILTVTSPSAPVIAGQPEDLTVSSGATATFEVIATGGPAPTYQWNLNGTPLPGATSATYTTPATTLAMNGGRYTVTVKNAVGSLTSSAALLTVRPSSAPASIPPGAILASGAYTSSAAAVEIPRLANGTQAFPAPWIWDGAKLANQPRAATPADGLTPKIEQIRDGQVIATYASFGSLNTAQNAPWPSATAPMDLAAFAALGGGPFGNVSHVDLFRIAQDGDSFLVYPAIYTGTRNNIFMGAKPDYYRDPISHPPTNITIKGVTQNGIRPVILNAAPAGDFASAQGPVYLFGDGAALNCTNIVIENLDVALDDTTAKGSGKGGIYINGVTNLTLRRMRVHGFQLMNGNGYGYNGLFSTSNNNGTLLLDQVELYRNGGTNGPAHNAYLGASTRDPNHTVRMINSWSHDAFYGHLFKSRIQINILEGNYFQGGVPQGGIYTQAENYLVDIPNGGVLTMRNNILVKTASGVNSNGAAVTYDVEGASSGPRNYSVDIQNNTFVALAKTYDGARRIWPFFFQGSQVPGTDGFKLPVYPAGTFASPPITIRRNAFVGFYPGSAAENYRGDLSVTAAFSELNQNFSLSNPIFSADTAIVGTPAYAHITQKGLTRRSFSSSGTQYSIIGAVDE